ncbi:hypothetical protein BDV96DRAFT_236398 [Lophiotrema nucula]|uniref:Uncharacterized protein n=1 Tax=Lophiotrema nucula TaxID=690887 RepID=A0A6A5YTM7_9PLEO|nr:hypothetical protein BDV96DRAFT_236398 [Lophiotrema nucula]
MILDCQYDYPSRPGQHSLPLMLFLLKATMRRKYSCALSPEENDQPAQKVKSRTLRLSGQDRIGLIKHEEFDVAHSLSPTALPLELDTESISPNPTFFNLRWSTWPLICMRLRVHLKLPSLRWYRMSSKLSFSLSPSLSSTTGGDVVEMKVSGVLERSAEKEIMAIRKQGGRQVGN